MSTADNRTLTVINTSFLSNLDKSELLLMLQSAQNRLLLATRNLGIENFEYINDLKKEVEVIQSELWSRIPDTEKPGT